jgi:hypothetical protein
MDMLGHSGHVVSPKKTKGKTMYMTIRKYQGCKDAKEINRVALAELLPVLRTIAGFRSYEIVDTGKETVASIGIFDSKEAAENANRQARAVVQRTALKDLLPNAPEITVGEVLGKAK